MTAGSRKDTFWRSFVRLLKYRPPRPPQVDFFEAQKRARHLLFGNLTPDQRVQLRNFGYFDVIGGDAGARYRIRNRPYYNVERLGPDDTPQAVFCFGPPIDLPFADCLLAQKVALETFESAALAVANVRSAW